MGSSAPHARHSTRNVSGGALIGNDSAPPQSGQFINIVVTSVRPCRARRAVAARPRACARWARSICALPCTRVRRNARQNNDYPTGLCLAETGLRERELPRLEHGQTLQGAPSSIFAARSQQPSAHWPGNNWRAQRARVQFDYRPCQHVFAWRRTDGHLRPTRHIDSATLDTTQVRTPLRAGFDANEAASAFQASRLIHFAASRSWYSALARRPLSRKALVSAERAPFFGSGLPGLRPK